MLWPKRLQVPLGEPITKFNFENKDYSEDFLGPDTKCDFLVINQRELKTL